MMNCPAQPPDAGIGRKIDAIKFARDVTHLGLKDTKDLVESLE